MEMNKLPDILFDNVTLASSEVNEVFLHILSKYDVRIKNCASVPSIPIELSAANAKSAIKHKYFGVLSGETVLTNIVPKGVDVLYVKGVEEALMEVDRAYTDSMIIPKVTDYVIVKFKNDKELSKIFSSEDLYYMSSNFRDVLGTQYTKITTLMELHTAYPNIYMKIERDVTWREAVTDFVNDNEYISLDDIERIIEGNCNIKTTQAFLEMCRIVTLMTKDKKLSIE